MSSIVWSCRRSGLSAAVGACASPRLVQAPPLPHATVDEIHGLLQLASFRQCVLNERRPLLLALVSTAASHAQPTSSCPAAGDPGAAVAAALAAAPAVPPCSDPTVDAMVTSASSRMVPPADLAPLAKPSRRPVATAGASAGPPCGDPTAEAMVTSASSRMVPPAGWTLLAMPGRRPVCGVGPLRSSASVCGPLLSLRPRPAVWPPPSPGPCQGQPLIQSDSLRRDRLVTEEEHVRHAHQARRLAVRTARTLPDAYLWSDPQFLVEGDSVPKCLEQCHLHARAR